MLKIEKSSNEEIVGVGVGGRIVNAPPTKTNFDINSENIGEPLLDSRLITATFFSKSSFKVSNLYNVKIVNCGDYSQVYIYKNKKMKKKINDEDLNLKKVKIEDITSLDKSKTINDKLELVNEIEDRNIIRSKLECQRLAKANISSWKTFITLTFDPEKVKIPVDNIINANKIFHSFITKVRRVKKDFKYICVPEFQKNGRVHYHLLSNVDINDNILIYSQKDNKKFKHIKYWNEGFTKVDNINKDVTVKKSKFFSQRI